LRNDEPDPIEDVVVKDKIVQQTDQDASVSRMSAVDVGYLNDAFAQHFAGERTRRFPIINRGQKPSSSPRKLGPLTGEAGTYVRTTAIDTLVDKFLAKNPSEKKQIISLGAGSDTRFFRLMERQPRPSLVYHELDFGSNTHHKIAAIARSSHLTSYISPPLLFAIDDTALYSPTFNIHPIDLRNLQPGADGAPLALDIKNVDPTLPTLLLSECCLIYLPPAAADMVVNYFSSCLFPRTTPLALLLYEPINPYDSFGKVMVSNLASRGIVLQTLHKYSSLQAQKERLRALGFASGQRAADVDYIWEHWVPEREKERVGGLEMLDEVEEWRMLARHYCVCWGWRDGDDEETGKGDVWELWKDLRSQ
jgi:[phosphatase 2A protein]-leucine-carboxy methyltransferase